MLTTHTNRGFLVGLFDLLAIKSGDDFRLFFMLITFASISNRNQLRNNLIMCKITIEIGLELQNMEARGCMRAIEQLIR